LMLLGLVWVGQGTDLIPGSFMTGSATWAVIGLVVLVVGTVLVRSVLRANRAARARLG
jgi:hypothetical protein